MAEAGPVKLCRDCAHVQFWYERHTFGAAIDFRCSLFCHPVTGLPLRCLELRTMESTRCKIEGEGHKRREEKGGAPIPLRMAQTPPPGSRTAKEDAAQIDGLKRFLQTEDV